MLGVIRNLLGKDSAESGLRRNAFWPIVSLVGVTIASVSLVTVKNDGITPTWMVVVVSVVVVVACFSYLWLLFKDPDRLQTEEYLIRTKALALIEHNNPDESLENIKIKIATLGPHERTDT